MMASKRIAIAAIVAAGIVAGTAWLLACGPFLTDLQTVSVVRPAHEAEFLRGDTGIVRPHLARSYLVHAYRTLSGNPASPDTRASAAPSSSGSRGDNRDLDPQQQWERVRDQILGPGSVPVANGPSLSPYRRVPNTYSQFLNCGDDAFLTAMRTAQARQDRFGAASEAVRGWARAQLAVFRNCGEEALVLPTAADAAADPLVRADRAYQTAAAYFYAMQYEEAARRFRAIADDESSPWRPYGHYLAARAAIRFATVPEDVRERAAERFAVAERDLEATIQDPNAESMHAAAKNLLGFVAARLHPVARVHEVSERLATAPQIDARDLEEYRVLMDRIIGDTVVYDYNTLEDRDRLIAGDDLTDWVLAIQDGRDRAAAHALDRWQTTKSMPWLVAALWTLPADHTSVPTVLDAAKAVDRTSPAFPTVAFLRVRLAAAAGRTDEARALLEGLPQRPAPGFQAETVNLLNAERLMLARTFDEFLAAAPRSIVATSMGDAVATGPTDLQQFTRPLLGEDAAVTFNDRFPLDRLVAAAESRILPNHLRLRIAAMAFSRAVLLQHEQAERAAARVLRALAPSVRADADRVLAATNATDRQRAAVMLLLRTPGVNASLALHEDDVSYAVNEPLRKFDHTFRRNWWCSIDETTARVAAFITTDWVTLLYPENRIPFPSFITDAERTKVEQERAALAATGAGRNFLASEAIRWAQASPNDLTAAEALALAIEGWRWSNCDQTPSPLPQRAFQTLHKLYPTSEWATRTRYWYR